MRIFSAEFFSDKKFSAENFRAIDANSRLLSGNFSREFRILHRRFHEEKFRFLDLSALLIPRLRKKIGEMHGFSKLSLAACKEEPLGEKRARRISLNTPATFQNFQEVRDEFRSFERSAGRGYA